MYLEDVHACLLVGEGDLDLAVEAAGAEQRGVEDVGTVRRHDDFHLPELVEPVELIQQLGGETRESVA